MSDSENKGCEGSHGQCGCGENNGEGAEHEDLIGEEPGSVWYSVVTEPWPGVDFLIRERSDEIAANSGCQGLSLRAGSVEIAGALVGVVLFRFREGGRIYSTAWNFFHPAEDGVNPCDVLCGDARLGFRFVGDGGEVDQVLIFDSSLASFFRHLRERATRMTPWSLEQFTQALGDVYGQFSEPAQLWQKFSE